MREIQSLKNRFFFSSVVRIMHELEKLILKFSLSCTKVTEAITNESISDFQIYLSKLSFF